MGPGRLRGEVVLLAIEVRSHIFFWTVSSPSKLGKQSCRCDGDMAEGMDLTSNLGRDLAAWLGLLPRQTSTGEEQDSWGSRSAETGIFARC